MELDEETLQLLGYRNAWPDFGELGGIEALRKLKRQIKQRKRKPAYHPKPKLLCTRCLRPIQRRHGNATVHVRCRS